MSEFTERNDRRQERGGKCLKQYRKPDAGRSGTGDRTVPKNPVQNAGTLSEGRGKLIC